MNRLKKLMETLCPDGVCYMKFSEVADYIRGITYGKGDELKLDSKEGIPVLRANNITLGKNALNFDDVKYVKPSVRIKDTQFLHSDDILICAGSGSKDHVGKVAFITEDMDYAFGGFMAVIRVKNDTELLPRYLFYQLTSARFRKHIGLTIESTTINNLSAKVVADFTIPIPPLEIQQEVVSVLDNLTNLSIELTEKLTTELYARKQQYEYYRECLMTFDDVPYVALDTLFPNIRNGFVGTVKKFFTDKENGVRYLEGTNIHNGIISDNEELYVTNEFHQKHLKSELKADDILMVQSGHIGECAVVGNKYKGANCHALIIMSNGGNCSSKFYVHYFHTQEGKKHLKPAITDGSLKHVLAGKMSFVKVPYPPIDEQRRIEGILDRFECLYNDITLSLTDELQARKQQYEYFRDEVLTFKEMHN